VVVGASGQITITAKGTSASTAGSTETFTTLGVWTGTISYPVVSLSDLAGSLTGTASAQTSCSFAGVAFNATYSGSSAPGPNVPDRWHPVPANWGTGGNLGLHRGYNPSTCD
jgi:hypothetical protein